MLGVRCGTRQRVAVIVPALVGSAAGLPRSVPREARHFLVVVSVIPVVVAVAGTGHIEYEVVARGSE